MVHLPIDGSTLVLPAVSIGNVPQLAADLLIHTYNLEKVGALDGKYLYPFLSPQDTADGSSSDVSFALEVFHSPELALTVLQQRSPIIPSYTLQFVLEVVVPFIATHNFKAVVVLESSDAGLIENVSKGDVHVLTSEDLLASTLDSMQLGPPSSHGLSYYVRVLLRETSNNTVLVSYVYEGDNFDDAELLAHKTQQHLKLKAQPWVKPASWLGVYGDRPVPNAMEEGLYG